MSAITLTYCDQAENHIENEQIGVLSNEGFTFGELKEVQENFGGDLLELECVRETDGKKIVNLIDKKAYLLIIKDGVNKLLDGRLTELKKEQFSLSPDKKAYMRGRVLNKHARHNLCFDDTGHPPDYENKKGTVIAYDTVPLTKLLRQRIASLLPEKCKDLVCEGNYYYDVKKCGIGFHGDAERRKVIAVRLGDSIPLHFQWFYKNKAVGKRIELVLNDGDMYIMSDKAVGFDWKKFNILSLRHAAGCPKFLEINKV